MEERALTEGKGQAADEDLIVRFAVSLSPIRSPKDSTYHFLLANSQCLSMLLAFSA